MFTTLTRARTAREAIAIMDALVQAYGYASSGESFGVGDPDEVWLMELIGKGKYGKGAVWVASRVPDGCVTGTANQARTQTFAQDDPDNVRFSPDVISFARDRRLDGHRLRPASRRPDSRPSVRPIRPAPPKPAVAVRIAHARRKRPRIRSWTEAARCPPLLGTRAQHSIRRRGMQ
jgi:hypothetical protein